MSKIIRALSLETDLSLLSVHKATKEILKHFYSLHYGSHWLFKGDVIWIGNRNVADSKKEAVQAQMVHRTSQRLAMSNASDS